MPKTQTTGMTGYISVGGTFNIHAIVLKEDGDYMICGYASRTIIEGIEDIDQVTWFTRRAQTSLLARVGTSIASLNELPLVGAKGGLTDFARAFNDDNGRNSRAYTTEEFAEKMDPKNAAKIVAGLRKVHTEDAAAAA